MKIFASLSNKMEIIEHDQEAVKDVIKTFEAEPSSDSDHPEQLVVFVVRGKAKEITGQHFTQDQVK